MSLNKVMLIGNLGADPEIKNTQDGRKLANFTIATSEKWKDKNTGERKEKTEWHRIVVFNEGLVGVVEQYLKKGSKVYVEGMLATRSWEQEGVKRYSTEIVLKAFNGTIDMLDTAGGSRRGASSEDDYGQTSTRSTTGGDSGKSTSYGADMDDDIPF